MSRLAKSSRGFSNKASSKLDKFSEKENYALELFNLGKFVEAEFYSTL